MKAEQIEELLVIAGDVAANRLSPIPSMREHHQMCIAKIAELTTVIRELTELRPMETAPRDGTMIEMAFPGPTSRLVAWRSGYGGGDAGGWMSNCGCYRRDGLGWRPIAPAVMPR